jgi:hypothetical protein
MGYSAGKFSTKWLEKWEILLQKIGGGKML